MISEQTSRGVKLVVGLILAAILIVGIAVSYIRFGGPLHRQNLLQDELLADILPPPAFVVEPYLHATWVLTDPGHAARAKAELAEERTLFDQRKAYWKAAPIPEELRGEVEATIGTADAFWAAIDQRFLPALEAGDLEVMRQVHHNELAPAYQKQHDAVERLVERSTAYRTTLMDNANRLVLLMIIAFAGIALAVFAIITAFLLKTESVGFC